MPCSLTGACYAARVLNHKKSMKFAPDPAKIPHYSLFDTWGAIKGHPNMALSQSPATPLLFTGIAEYYVITSNVHVHVLYIIVVCTIFE